MRFFVGYVAVIAIAEGAPLAPFIKSPKRGEYKVCTFLGAGREGSVVRAALPGHECDDPSHLVAIKCAKTSGYDVRLANKFQNEFDIMSNLSKHDWCPRVAELFHNAAPPNSVCIAMGEVGRSVSWTRDRDGRIWTPNTVLSIGIGIMDIMTVMHFDLNLYLADVHMGNFALGKDDQSKLMLIDYADMRPLETPGKTNRKVALITDDIRHAILSLRYLFDGRYRFYSAKRYSGYDKSVVCHAAYVHSAVCEAIDYVYTKQGMFTREDYDHVNEILKAGLSGVEYKGKIIWEPVLSRPAIMTAYISAKTVMAAPAVPVPVNPPISPSRPVLAQKTKFPPPSTNVEKPKSVERPPATTRLTPAVTPGLPQTPLRPVTTVAPAPMTPVTKRPSEPAAHAATTPARKQPSEPAAPAPTTPAKKQPSEPARTTLKPALFVSEATPVSPEEPPKPLAFAIESTTSTTKSSFTTTSTMVIALILALAVRI
jgi:hypothetical protein